MEQTEGGARCILRLPVPFLLRNLRGSVKIYLCRPAPGHGGAAAVRTPVRLCEWRGLNGHHFDGRMENEMNYTYIVRCSDGTLYTGWTNNLEKRIKDHNSGKGAKYTKSRRPVVLAYYEEFETREEAMRREWEVKRLTRAQKLRMIKADS